MEGKIQCKICERWFNLISVTHLKNKHNMTQKEYKEKYGTIVSENYHNNMSASINKLSKDSEHIKKLSDSVKKYHANLSEEMKNKRAHNISISLKGKKLSEEHKKAVSVGMKNMTDEAKQIRAKKISDKNYEQYANGERDRLTCNIKRTRKSLNTTCPEAQKILFEKIKNIFPNTELNYPIITNGNLYFIDIFIPLYDLCIEHDNSKSHKSSYYIAHDKNRDNDLRKANYKIIHYVDIIPDETQIREAVKKIGIKPIVVYKY